MIDLELGMTPEEIDENMSHLTEKEIDELIRNSEAVMQYQEQVSSVAKTVDQKKFEKLYEAYTDEMVNINEQYLDDLKLQQKEADDLADVVEEKANQQVDAVVQETEEDVGEVVDQIKEVNDELTRIVTKSNS